VQVQDILVQQDPHNKDIPVVLARAVVLREQREAVVVQGRQVKQEPQEVLAVKVAMAIYGQSRGHILLEAGAVEFIMAQVELAAQAAVVQADLLYQHNRVVWDGQTTVAGPVAAQVEVVLLQQEVPV
jgi:hypothetical protein